MKRKKYFKRKVIFSFSVISLLVLSLVGCTGHDARQEPNIIQGINPLTHIKSPFPVEPTPPKSLGLSVEQISTLNSLRKVDDYPLYTMHYSGSYPQIEYPPAVNNIESFWANGNSSKISQDWGCSLFAALADTSNMYFGRNFDWEFSPGLLLFTHPPNGYASVSMVDIAYLGFSQDQMRSLTDLSLIDRKPLLRAPYWPFDGMNEHGLAIGMAAVPHGRMLADPTKEPIGSLQIMRQILDNAASVDQAITIFESYNIEFEPGPALHYLIADSSGEAILVEFFEGQIHLLPAENTWHQATNFLASSVDEPHGYCSRYDKITNEMIKTGGSLTPASAMKLLDVVSQTNTQ